MPPFFTGPRMSGVAMQTRFATPAGCPPGGSAKSVSRVGNAVLIECGQSTRVGDGTCVDNEERISGADAPMLTARTEFNSTPEL